MYDRYYSHIRNSLSINYSCEKPCLVVDACPQRTWRQKQENCVLKANQGYIVTFSPPRTIHDILSQNNTTLYIQACLRLGGLEKKWNSLGLGISLVEHMPTTMHKFLGSIPSISHFSPHPKKNLKEERGKVRKNERMKCSVLTTRRRAHSVPDAF